MTDARQQQKLTLAEVEVLLQQWEQDLYTQDTANALWALLAHDKALRVIADWDVKHDMRSYAEILHKIQEAARVVLLPKGEDDA